MVPPTCGPGRIGVGPDRICLGDGEAGPDLIDGGTGNDVIDPPGAGIGVPPATGADTVLAGPGDDLITKQLDGGRDLTDAGPGNDRCTDVVTSCETVVRVPAGG